jgi:DNA primase
VIGAGVSTPLRWDELDDVWPLDLNLLTVPERLSKMGDLWADILSNKHDLSALAQSVKEHPIPT